MKKSMSIYWIGIIILAVLILDQVSKYFIKTSMALGQQISVIGNFFKITYVENPGMAFGVRMGNPAVFIGLSVLAAILVFYYLYRLRREAWPLQLALGWITAGALGNLTDRFLHGRVVDMFDFEFFDIHIPAFNIFSVHFSGYDMLRWPVFNVADMAVTGGMIILITYILFVGDPLKTSEKNISNSTANV